MFKPRTVLLSLAFLHLMAVAPAAAHKPATDASQPITANAFTRPYSPFEDLYDNPDGKHYVHILDVGDEALLARIHLIRTAKESIDIQTFIWTNDESGRYVAYELLEAAERGVKVKIIVDRWKSAHVTGLVAFLATAHPNIEVKTYNPPAQQVNPSALRLLPEVFLNFKQVNQRMHNKTFIVDNKVGITGGRNYENDYFDRGLRRNFKDRDVLVVGPVVQAMTDSFFEYWDFGLTFDCADLLDVGRLIESGRYEKFASRADFRLGDLFDETDRLASDNRYIRRTFIDHIFEVEKVQFIYDHPGKNEQPGLRGGGAATTELAKIIFGAKDSIVAQTPYLVLDNFTIDGVKKLRREKPDIDIMISSNSLAITDHVHAYAFSYKQKKLFVRDLRFRIFELKASPADIDAMMPLYTHNFRNRGGRGDEEAVDSLTGESVDNDIESTQKHLCIHAKSFVIDDAIAWIGSFNLDPRSVHLNTEVGLVVWDEGVARALKENILRDMAPQNSWTIGKRKEVPLISDFSEIVGDMVQRMPLIDVWPFRYTSSYMLKEGKDIVPFYDKDFYQNYYSVGSFPEVGLSLREIETRLIKALAGVVMPII